MNTEKEIVQEIESVREVAEHKVALLMAELFMARGGYKVGETLYGGDRRFVIESVSIDTDYGPGLVGSLSSPKHFLSSSELGAWERKQCGYCDGKHRTEDCKGEKTKRAKRATLIRNSCLTARARNCLISENLLTVGAVRDVSDKNLRLIPNLGKKTLMEIRDFVGR